MDTHSETITIEREVTDYEIRPICICQRMWFCQVILSQNKYYEDTQVVQRAETLNLLCHILNNYRNHPILVIPVKYVVLQKLKNKTNIIILFRGQLC